jgi:hypothetical protein
MRVAEKLDWKGLKDLYTVLDSNLETACCLHLQGNIIPSANHSNHLNLFQTPCKMAEVGYAKRQKISCTV